MQPREREAASSSAKRWAWFVALWLAGVATLAAVAALIRLLLP